MLPVPHSPFQYCIHLILKPFIFPVPSVLGGSYSCSSTNFDVGDWQLLITCIIKQLITRSEKWNPSLVGFQPPDCLPAVPLIALRLPILIHCPLVANDGQSPNANRDQIHKAIPLGRCPHLYLKSQSILYLRSSKHEW